jgi:inorganic phosphate transporter, PiT family
MADHQGDAFLFVILLGLGILFDFVRGFHEPACVLSPLIYTRALSLGLALPFALLSTLVIAFFLPVIPTLGTILDPAVNGYAVLAAALSAAIAWNLVSWGLRLPVVTSHALVGGFVGAGIAAGGSSAVRWVALQKPFLGIVLSLSLCLGLGALLALCFSGLRSRSPSSRGARVFRALQLVPVGLYFFLNEGALPTKTTAILVLLLVTRGYVEPRVAPISFLDPRFTWIFLVAVLSYSIMYLGTLSGGRRIIRTMGSRIARLRPVDGFVAATTSFLFIFVARFFVPFATTPSIAGAIVGSRAVKGLPAVRWSVPLFMCLAWALTIPAAAALGFVFHSGFRALFESLGFPR